MSDYSKNIVYLSQAQYQQLITNNTITVNGVTINYDDNDLYVTPQDEPITDVQINGTSIGVNGIANIPIGKDSNLGVVKISQSAATAYGVTIDNTGQVLTAPATEAQIKGGGMARPPIVPESQHKSVFYGLSKIAGVDLANETVTLGIYPDSSKAAIQNMLGVTDLLSTEESSPATAAHALNSTFMMDGKLYRATAAIAIGDAVVEGQNCEVTNIQQRLENCWNKNEMKIDGIYGIYLTNDGYLTIKQAGPTYIAAGRSYGEMITPANQHLSVFYGLAKISGDTTQSTSNNTAGTYTPEASAAIRNMLGAAAASDMPQNVTDLTNDAHFTSASFVGTGLVLSTASTWAEGVSF